MSKIETVLKKLEKEKDRRRQDNKDNRLSPNDLEILFLDDFGDRLLQWNKWIDGSIKDFVPRVGDTIYVDRPDFLSKQKMMVYEVAYNAVEPNFIYVSLKPIKEDK